MIGFQGIHVAKVDPGRAAPKGTVMHHKHATIADGLVMDAHTLISHVGLASRPARIMHLARGKLRAINDPSLPEHLIGRGPVWVKRRNTRCEQMFSAVHPTTDIAQQVGMSVRCQKPTNQVVRQGRSAV